MHVHVHVYHNIPYYNFAESVEQCVPLVSHKIIVRLYFFLSLFSYYGDGIRLYLGPLICIICVYMYNHITSFFDYIGGYRIHAVSVDYYYYRRNSTGNVFRQKALLR